MRETILTEIRRLADLNGGKAPGAKAFEDQTGMSQSAWRGKYWARWTDAVKEAGLAPNEPHIKLEDDHLLEKLAEAFRHFGKAPTYAELRLYRRDHQDFPHRAMQNRFQSTAEAHNRLLEWARTQQGYSDIVAMLEGVTTEAEAESSGRTDGFVYLIAWGNYFKIGRGEELERRVKQVQTGLPDSGKLVHAIKTDDPSGIEAYWHRRFAEKRAENGEWFKLSKADVTAFKRRKFQ